MRLPKRPGRPGPALRPHRPAPCAALALSALLVAGLPARLPAAIAATGQEGSTAGSGDGMPADAAPPAGRLAARALPLQGQAVSAIPGGREGGSGNVAPATGEATAPASTRQELPPATTGPTEDERLRLAQEELEKAEERRFRDRLLDESIDRLLPLEPGELKDFIHRRDAVEGAVEPGPATMRMGTRSLSVTPAGTPQVVRLTAGYSSTLLFQDATGQPWPVLSVILGNARAFQVSQPRVVQETAQAAQDQPKGGQAASRPSREEEASDPQSSGANVHSHLVNVVPLTNHAASNLVVTLEQAPYPVILHLLTESSAKEGRVDDALVVFRMEGRGPNARVPVVGPSLPGAVDATLLSFVHGLAPEGARRLHFSPDLPGVQAWAFGGHIYLRSQFKAVWPAWTSVASGEGVQVYVMPKAPSLVVSAHGRRVRLLLKAGTQDGDS